MNSRAILQQMPNCCVAVIGDIMIDRYVWGHASRISQEAPVPVLHVSRRSAALGGAANVLRNLVGLGVSALGFGLIGADDAATEVRSLLAQAGIQADGLIVDPARPTTRKTRVIADRQQIVRVDDEVTFPASEQIVSQQIERLAAALATTQIDAIIVEDYAKGAVTQSLLEQVADLAHRADIPVALDPHPRNRLRVSGLALIKPNRSEAYAMSGLPDNAPLQEVAAKLIHDLEPEQLLITLGADGMALTADADGFHIIPTAAREVFDVSGAGDTVIATYVAAIAAGAAPEQAVALANAAGGVVVAHLGTTPITRDELFSAIDLE